MKHCLVVDDSEVIRKVARRILESMHFEVTEAENGQEAIERCQQRMPDTVLLDWHMPVMSGLEFLGALRLSKGERPRPYIFYCLTENDPSEIARAFVGGANDYILKPFDRASLADKFARAGLT
ncbi:MAG: response regulator [Proteobacteria bacterium]|nr:response regulator [Pseudomonadota bacterium]